ncbi:MAG: hypothetical protein SGARI_003746, partial [Bacillariaceae sp.]
VGPDELSSVGSNSLTSPRNTHASLRMPSYSSSTITAPIQEEPIAPAMKPVPKEMPLPSTKLPVVSGTAIPDFTATSPNAKWEKVESANHGDDDYVPLVDYSKLKDSTKTAAAATTTSDYDDAATAASTKQSRVAAFRAQKRRLRKKRRRQMGILLLCAVAFGGYLMYVKQSSSNAAIDDDKIAEVSQETEETLEDVAVVDIVPLEDITEDVEADTDALDISERVENIMQMVGETDAFCDTDAEDYEVTDETAEVVSDEESELEKEAVVTKAKVETVEEPEATESTKKEEVMTTNTDESPKPHTLLQKKCKNPLHKVFNKKCRILN